MNKVIKIAATSCFALMAAQTASAATFTYDFDSLTANEALTEITVGTSVFSVVSSVNYANIFDTTDALTSDHSADDDIIPATQGENGVAGNVLIIQEDGTNDLANDRRFGGRITFTLDNGPSLALIGASVIDDGFFTFGTSLSSDLLGGVTLSGQSTTDMLTFDQAFLSIGDAFFIDFNGQSGAVDTLVFDDGLTAVPVPAALPLLLAGIGGLGLMGRRQKKAAKA